MSIFNFANLGNQKPQKIEMEYLVRHNDKMEFLVWLEEGADLSETGFYRINEKGERCLVYKASDSDVLWADLPPKYKTLANVELMRTELYYVCLLESLLLSIPQWNEIETEKRLKGYVQMGWADGELKRIDRGLVVIRSYVAMLEALVAVMLIVFILDEMETLLTYERFQGNIKISYAKILKEAMKEIECLDELESFPLDRSSDVKLISKDIARQFFLHMVEKRPAVTTNSINNIAFSHVKNKCITEVALLEVTNGIMRPFPRNGSFRSLYNNIQRLLRHIEFGTPVGFAFDALLLAADKISLLFVPIVDVATPSMLESAGLDVYAPFGGAYDFESIYGVNPDGSRGEYDPPHEFGLSMHDINGVSWIPVLGVDDNKSTMRYNIAEHLWCVGDKHFSDKTNKDKKYKITRWRAEINGTKTEPCNDGQYSIPNIGEDRQGNRIRYDARIHDWNVGDKAFTSIYDWEHEYTITSYRTFRIGRTPFK